MSGMLQSCKSDYAIVELQDLSLDEIEFVSGGTNWDVVAAGAALFSAGCFAAAVCPPAGALAMSVGLHMAVAGAVMSPD